MERGRLGRKQGTEEWMKADDDFTVPTCGLACSCISDAIGAYQIEVDIG